jgi:hypothetical protein
VDELYLGGKKELPRGSKSLLCVNYYSFAHRTVMVFTDATTIKFPLCWKLEE